MNTSKSLDLRGILLQHFRPDCDQSCLQSHFDEDLARAEQAIVEAVEGLIGEDEPYEYINNKVEVKRNDKREIRNKLRAEQRKAIKEWQ